MSFPKTVSFSSVFTLFGILLFFAAYSFGGAGTIPLRRLNYMPEDSNKKDTTKLKYPINNNTGDPLSNEKSHNLDLGKPSEIKKHVELDSTGENYIIYETLGGVRLGTPEVVPVDEYLQRQSKKEEKSYFMERSQASNTVQNRSFMDDIDLGPNLIDKILSGGWVDLQLQGAAELIFAGDFNRIENPAWNVQQQRTGQFKFDQKIQLNLTGNIADRFNLNLAYDTEANFEFDNQIKLKYEGKEDDIIQSIEAGNVSLPTPGTLIQGSQSLFGVKTELRFGRLEMTSIYTQQRSERKEVTLEGGAQLKEFNVPANEYDQNRHFFLAQYFRDQYEQALSTLPVIRSQVRINRIEVWITNQNAATQETRNILAFQDLGEANPYNGENGGTFAVSNPNWRSGLPDTQANSLYSNLKSDPRFRQNSLVASAFADLNTSDPNAQMQDGRDYAKIDNARKLNESEYQLHPILGYISLNRELQQDEVLAVAFEYVLNGRTYQVGEFGRDQDPNRTNPQVLFLKMLKSYTLRPDLPIWDLMMKNIYAIGGYQIEQENFRLQVIYEDDETGGDYNYIPEPSEPELSGKPLLQVLNLDQLNQVQEKQPDGLFDFVPDLTVLKQNGRIIFPVLEPFGSSLVPKFQDQELAQFYNYQSLYDSTQFIATQDAEKNKFFLRGYFQSSGGNSISIGAINVPEGSVTVTANGVELSENIDYTVDYTLGRVNIINESLINSGAVIKVSAETNTLFNNLNRTLVGSRFDYTLSEDFLLGGTIMYLRERPITPKVNLGNEPLANVIWGLDGSYRTDSRLITKLVDRIPLIDSKEESEVLVSGEFAHFIPGHPKVIGDEGTSYLDDFEGAEIPINLMVGNYWEISAPPEGQPELIQNASLVNDYRSNFRRAKISWYSIDNLFFRNNNLTPNHIKADQQMQSNHFMREVRQDEVFPNVQIPTGVPPTLNTFDIAFFPKERGPYNFNVSGLDDNGLLTNPEQSWGGIMRRMDQTNFEANNIQYIEFWLMDPFAEDTDEEMQGGDMYINLGNLSEDILKDGLKAYENGLPANGNLENNARIEKTAWGYVPQTDPINYAFDNDPDSRPNQDVGLDGMDNENERAFFDSAFLQPLAQRFGTNSPIYQALASDPAADDYQFYRGSELDEQEVNIIKR